MAGWLNRSREEVRVPLVPEEEVLAHLPASVRGPEANRFTPLGSDMPETDDEHDPDIDFFASIAKEVDAKTPVVAVTGASTPKPVQSVNQYVIPSAAPTITVRTQKDILDDMELFREMKGELGDIRYNFHLADVDMADLLEDLSTTALALQQRKAA